MMTSKLVEIEVEVKRETELAYCVADGSEEDMGRGKKKLKLFWLPKSLVEKHEEGSKTIFVLPEWLANRKGLI